MKLIGKNLPKKKKLKPAKGQMKRGFTFFISILVFLLTFQTLCQTSAIPVITNDSWSDTFDDSNGVNSSYNVNISEGDVKLDGYRNDFEDEKLGQIPVNWVKEISGGIGNRFNIVNHYYEPGQAIWLRVNDDLTAFNSQKIYIEFTKYYKNIAFELTLHAISGATERQGYFSIELFNNMAIKYHEIRYYWDDARSGIPLNSSSLTVIDWGFDLPIGDPLGNKYFIFENISQDININPSADLTHILGNISKVRYGFYADAGPEWDRWEQVIIDNMGIYNDNYGNLTSSTIPLPSGNGWTNVSLSKSEPNIETCINMSVLDGETLQVIIPYTNLSDFIINISLINPVDHPTIRLLVQFFGNSYATPYLHDWTVEWIEIQKSPLSYAGEDQIVREGEIVYFNGSLSMDIDGRIEILEWDFDASDGLWWETGAITDQTGSTAIHIYGDNGVFITTLRVIDNDNLSAIDTCNITVLNIDPTIEIESASMQVGIGLRVAGRKFNDVGMTLFEEGNSMGYISIERLPGSPNDQMSWIPMTLDMTKTYSATVTYTPEDPPNMGGNPVWIYIKFQNGSIQKIHHTFNVQQSKNRDSDHWNHVEPWEVDLNSHLVGWEFEVDYHVTDPGSDDVILSFSYGSQNVKVTHLSNPPNPDPYPSPDVNPKDIFGTTTLVYEGTKSMVIQLNDDDKGSVFQSLKIK